MNFAYSLLQKVSITLRSIYFKEVIIIGKENIPIDGPIIIVANHANQFIDPAIICSIVPRNISFTIAESSFSKPIIGPIAKSINAISVIRAEDHKEKGKGKIIFDINNKFQINNPDSSSKEETIFHVKIKGIDTEFTKPIQKFIEKKYSPTNWNILIAGKSIIVKKVESDNSLIVLYTDEIEEFKDKENNFYVSSIQN